MTLVWTVIIFNSNTGAEQDLTAVGAVDMQQTVFNPTTSPHPSPSRLVLSFPIATPGLSILEMAEVWAGWRDDTTHVWSLVDPNGETDLPFGGYITRIDSELTFGGEKRMELSLSDYGILLSKTDVKGWPVFFDHAPVDFSGGTYVNVGYPPGGTVQEWLIGSSPYNGVVNAHLAGGMRYDGVDPIFDTISFDQTTMPGTIMAIPGVGMIQGYFGGEGMSVEKVVQAIADCAVWTYVANYFGGPDLVVGYWMAAMPGSDDTMIVPQFNFKNVADLVTTPDFTVAADADESIGEVQILHPYSHSRDASEIRTRINLFGVGGEPPDQNDLNPQLIFASYAQSDHMAIYPTKYQIEPGWGGGCLFDNRLHNVGTAQQLSRYIENRVWGARGSIEFMIQHPAYPGQRVRFRDPNEGIDRVYMVTESERQADGLWRVRIGFTQQTVADIIKGGLPDVVLTKEDLQFNLFWSSRTYPGRNQQNPITQNPMHGEQNFVTAPYSDTPGLSIQGSAVTNPDAGGTSLTNPLSFQVLPPPNFNLVPTRLFPDPGTWTSHADARPHPNCLHCGAYTADGLVPLTIPVYKLVLSFIDVQGPAAAYITKNGVDVAGPFSFGHWQINSHTAVTFKPIDMIQNPPTPADVIGIRLAGTSTSTPTFVVLWEGP